MSGIQDRRRSRERGGMPLIASLLAVGLLAAGLGYVLGLYLTGAIGTADPSPGQVTMPQPGPGGPAAPGDDDQAPGDDDQAAGGGDGGQAAPGNGQAAAGDGDQAAAPAAGSSVAVEVRVPATEAYVLQLGVFSTAEGAERLLRDLREAGFDGVLVRKGDYRVWVGAFADRERGRPYAAALQEAGFETYLAERRLAGAGVLRAEDAEPALLLREHLEALPGRLRAVAALFPPEPAGDAAALAAALREAERALSAAAVPDHLEDLHERTLRLHRTLIQVAERAAASAPADPAGVPPDLLALAAAALAEAEEVVARLVR